MLLRLFILILVINKIIEKNLIKIYYSFSYNQKNNSYKKMRNI